MTATVVALGGKAASTSRGSSLKGFIQSGAGFAEVSIWLKNGGPDAYRPEVYGRCIEVVRRIMADGAGQYKMKSSWGQVVSTKKEELMNILDQFNIQVCVSWDHIINHHITCKPPQEIILKKQHPMESWCLLLRKRSDPTHFLLVGVKENIILTSLHHSLMRI